MSSERHLILRGKVVLVLLFSVFVSLAIAQTRPAHAPAKGNSSNPDEQFKGIFEPVSYQQDVNLTDAFFASGDEGWVTGEHGTILHTNDGGVHWEVQLGGNSKGAEHTIHSLRFLDARQGWAIQDDPARLLHTADGQKWEEVNGQFPSGTPALDYAFTSATHAILLGGNGDAFYVSNDGGAHWKQVMPCQLSVIAQGLSRNEYCKFVRLQMLSARTGYALARWSSPEAPNADSIAFFKTEDAGEHWDAIVTGLRDCCGPESFFNKTDHGVMLFNTGKTYVTSDGGKNWHSLLSARIELTSGGPSPALRFADPEVGWVLGHSSNNRDAYRVCYSTDGGEHWKSSRDIPFPGGVMVDLKFAFPRRDRAYVIGPHGMIYRYRVVPASYAAPKGLAGPLMPASRNPEEQHH